LTVGFQLEDFCPKIFQNLVLINGKNFVKDESCCY
jgi:hypothetical protein